MSDLSTGTPRKEVTISHVRCNPREVGSKRNDRTQLRTPVPEIRQIRKQRRVHYQRRRPGVLKNVENFIASQTRVHSDEYSTAHGNAEVSGKQRFTVHGKECHT